MSKPERTPYGIAALFAVAGIAHFVIPTFFVRIVPAWVPGAHAAVWWSGVAELAGAVGLLWTRTRVAAAWGLMALLVAVFPANVQMLMDARTHGEGLVFVALLWMRLPLQAVLLWWVWRVALPRDAGKGEA